MKILITGGAGFIGSWVAEAMIAEGFEVVVVDDLSSGREENIPNEADFIKCDIRDFQSLERVFGEFKPDFVNHHAAQINVRSSVEHPVTDAAINIIGTLNLLCISAAHHIKKFVFASTGGAIYGKPKRLPTDESHPPAPLSPYGISKYAAELYLNHFKSFHGLDYVALRYSNVYGPKQNPHGEAGVVAIFCYRIKQGEPCLIFGDGNQTRDYVYVEDVALANTLALRAPSGTYNIGTGIETSVNNLIAMLEKATGTEVDTRNVPPIPGEVFRIALDCALARDALSWSPQTTVDEGIGKTWEWFK